MIDICLAFRDNDGRYTMHAGAVLVSILKNTAASIHVHIIHDDTLNATRKKILNAVVEYYAQKITYYNIKKFSDKLAHLKIARIGIGSVYRIYIPYLIKSEFVIYIDCDICFNIDIHDIIYDLKNKDSVFLSCVQDQGAKFSPVVREYLQNIHLDPDQYFNSGMIVFHTLKIEKYFTNITHDMLNILWHFPRLLFVDQDILNMIFNKFPMCWLPDAYNFQLNTDIRINMDSTALQGKVLHYCDSKPWEDPMCPAKRIHLENYTRIGEILKHNTI